MRPLNRVDIAFAAIVGATIGTWTVMLLWQAVSPTAALLAAPLVLLGHAALAWRRSAPMWSLTLVSVACAGQLAAAGGLPLLPSLLGFPLAVHAGCAYGRPVGSWAFGVVGAAAATIGYAFTPGQPVPTPILGSLLLAVVVIAASLGMYRRIQLAYLAQLADRAAHAEARREERARQATLAERARIAREMHDLVAHSLSVVVSQARGGRYAPPERAAQVLATIEDAGRRALTEMRSLLGVLRAGDDASVAAGEHGVGPLPDLSGLPELVARAGLSVSFTETGPAVPLPSIAGLAAYRLVQEALANTVRHAGPGARAQVHLTWTGHDLVVEVRDDGGGPQPDSRPGLGLTGMRERVSLAGGTLTVGAAPGGGFLVRAHLPTEAA